MKILELQLDEPDATRFHEAAERLGISPEEFLRVSVEEKLARMNELFEAAAEHVLLKNKELYRRLA